MTNPRDDLMAPEIDLHTHCGADARRWAEAFSQIKTRQGWSVDDIDTDLMIGWFANAIEVACAIRLAASRPAPVDREAAAWQWWDSVLAKWCVCSKLAFDNLADYPHIKRRELYSHPPKSPDTSAAVLAERERCAAIADEWANKMARNHGRETANTIAAAIRQLPTPERGDK